jgi:putative transposase
MNKKALEAFAKQAAQGIKSEQDLTFFRKTLTQITVKAVLNSELEVHLGYALHEQSNTNNSRNGYSSKYIRTEDGQVDLKTPTTENTASGHNELKKTKHDSPQWTIKSCTCMPKA